MPEDWAAAQYGLGAALLASASRDEGTRGAAYLEQAIAALRSALEVYTSEQMQEYRARTENVLGDALQDLAARSKGR